MIPFTKSSELFSDLVQHGDGSLSMSHLPGYPSIPLGDTFAVNTFIERDLYAHDLETIAPRLWIMTTPSSANIGELHRQEVNGRKIVLTEDARLHLSWIHDRIFIKPLPRYLLSHTFWNMYLGKNQTSVKTLKIRGAALGYLRSYCHLIRYESDFRIAQKDELQLVPPGTTWASFCQFSTELRRITDEDVSGRYQYGELRLSRLNFYAPFLMRKSHFERVHRQYSTFFARFYGPVLFVFAVISIILNSMQVELAVEQLDASPWMEMRSAARGFSVMSLFGVAVILAWVSALWLFLFIDEWVYTLRARVRRRRAQRVQSSL